MLPDGVSRDSAAFPSTEWSLIDVIRSGNIDSKRDALDRFVRVYWPAMRAHLVWRKTVAADLADDVVQEFVASKLLEKNILASVERGRGKLRTYLLTILDRMVIDEFRKTKRVARGLDGLDFEDPEVPHDVFNQAWARTVLHQTLQLTKTDCDAKHQQAIWLVFFNRVLAPLIAGCEELSYSELVVRTGFQTPKQTHNALATGKRKFRSWLMHVVGQYVPVEGVDQELHSLAQILRTPGSVDISRWMEFAPGKKDQQSQTLTDVSRSKGNKLDRLIREADAAIDWPVEHLAEMWQQQCALPLQNLVATHSDCELESDPDAGIKGTLTELLTDPNPAVASLTSIKRAARHSTANDDGTIQRQLALVVYYACIAKAIIVTRKNISKLNPIKLKVCLVEVSGLPWIDDVTRRLLKSGSEDLQSC